MTFKQLEGFLVKIVLFISYCFFPKDWPVYPEDNDLKKKHLSSYKANTKQIVSIHMQTTKISSTKEEKRNWNFIRNDSKCLLMSYNITCFTKIFTFAIASVPISEFKGSIWCSKRASYLGNISWLDSSRLMIV